MKINVPSQPVYLEADEEKQLIYVSHPRNDSVGVIDAASGEYVRSIPVGRYPGYMAMIRSRSLVVTANYDGSSLSFIDINNNFEATEIPVEQKPKHIGVAPDERRLIVPHGQTSCVTVVNFGARNSVSAHVVEVGSDPEEATFLQDSATAVVVSRDSKSLEMVDTNNSEKIRSIRIGHDLSHRPGSVAVSPTTDEIYVACPLASLVVIVDRSGEIVGEIHIPGAPIFVSSLTGSSLIYVLDSVKHTISFIDPVSRNQVSKLNVGRTPLTAFEARDAKLLLVIGFEEQTLSIIDYLNFNILERVPLSGRPFGTTVMYKNQMAYVASEDDACIDLVPMSRVFARSSKAAQ